MGVHKIKTWPVYFYEVASGNKTFELRKFDRNYKIGDTLILQCYNPDTISDTGYTGEEASFIITHILDNAEQFGLMPGYCILSIQRTN
jgi:hypothetical protein